MQPFDGDVVINACNDNLTVTRLGCLFDREQIAIEDAGIAHAQALDLQEVIGPLAKEVEIDRELFFDIFGRQHR